jgi:hypothetical protein
MSKTQTRTAPAPCCFTCPYHEPDARSARLGPEGPGPGSPIQEAGAFAGVYGDGLCKRYPRPEPKGPLDWCGEHPELAARARRAAAAK